MVENLPINKISVVKTPRRLELYVFWLLSLMSKISSSLVPKVDRCFKRPHSSNPIIPCISSKKYSPWNYRQPEGNVACKNRSSIIVSKIFKTHDIEKKTYRLETKRARIIVERANVEKPRNTTYSGNETSLHSITTPLFGKSTKIMQFRAILADVPGVNYVETLPHNTTRRSLHAVYASRGQIMSGIGYIRKPLCLVTERGIERPV